MLQLAAEYERKSIRAEHAEAWLRKTSYDEDAPLVPE